MNLTSQIGFNSLEKILRYAAGTSYFEDKKGIHISNFTSMYEGLVRDLDFDMSLFLKDISQDGIDSFRTKIDNKPFLTVNSYVSNEDSKTFFRNVNLILDDPQNHRSYSTIDEYEGKDRFRTLARKARSRKDHIVSNLGPILFGRSISEIIELAKGASGELNHFRILPNSIEEVSIYESNNKQNKDSENLGIDSTSEERVRDIVGEDPYMKHKVLKFGVKSFESIFSSLDVAYWYLGNSELIISKSTDKINISEIGLEHDAFEGSFTLLIPYIEDESLLSKVSDLSLFPLRKPLKKKNSKRIQRNYKEIQRKQAEINCHVETVSSRVISRLDAMRDKDIHTSHHEVREALIKTFFLRKFQAPTSFVVDSILGGAEHDSGKTAVPDEILQTPKKYTAQEYAIMKIHACMGAYISSRRYLYLKKEGRLNPAEEQAIANQISLKIYHQEHYDGSGYLGLTGDEISPLGQLSTIIDQFDAMRFSRQYKPAFSFDKTLAIMMESRPRYNPFYFDLFLKEVVPDLRAMNYGDSFFDYNSSQNTKFGNDFISFIIGNNSKYISRNTHAIKSFNESLVAHNGLDFTLESIYEFSKYHVERQFADLEESNYKVTLRGMYGNRGLNIN